MSFNFQIIYKLTVCFLGQNLQFLGQNLQFYIKIKEKDIDKF